LCEKYEVPAASLAVMTKEGVTFYSYGKNHHGNLVDEHTIFEGASLSKTVLSQVVNQSLTECLDTSCSLTDLQVSTRALDEFYDHKLSKKQLDQLLAIKVRQLLQHTSGIDAILENKVETLDTFSYSENGYLLLQFVFNEVKGKEFIETLPQGVLDQHFHFVWQDAMERNYVDGFLSLGVPDRPIRHYTKVKSNGSLLCSTEGLTDFLRILDSSFITEMYRSRRPINHNYPGLSWGNGIGIEDNETSSYLWQWGNNYSYNGVLMVDVKRDRVMVLLANSVSSRKIFEQMACHVFEENDFESFDYVW